MRACADDISVSVWGPDGARHIARSFRAADKCCCCFKGAEGRCCEEDQDKEKAEGKVEAGGADHT